MKIVTRKLNNQEILNSHLEWYSDLERKLRKMVDKISAKMQRIKREEEYHMDDDERLLKMFLMHLDEYIQRLKEVEGFGFGGIEPDLNLPDIENPIDSVQKKNKYDLGRAISNYWSKSAMAYVHGDFRGCIFQSATMLEGALKLKIKEEGLEQDLNGWLKKRKATLGNLIGFLKDKGVLPDETIESAESVNHLRVEHIHLLIEERPEKVFQITERDEFIPLNQFKGNPSIEIKDGWISGDGVTFLVDFEKGTQGILYKYKKDAKECLDKLREILRKLYPRESVHFLK